MTRFAALLFSFVFAAALLLYPRPPTILYVPLDNRPVNLDWVLALSRLAGTRLLVPPGELLNSGEDHTDPEPLLAWLEANHRRADALVLSLDALLYGGLVPSRTHSFSPQELASRLNRLASLTGKPVFAFAVLMRSKVTAASSGQPGYFAQYGDKLNRLSELFGRESQGLASPAEQAELAALQAELPEAVLGDYLARRRTNLAVLEEALALFGQGAFTHLVLGRDDAAPFSFTRMELCSLEHLLDRTGATSFPGADELGALLFARAANGLAGFTPRVHVSYSAPDFAGLVPRYEDVPLKDGTLARLRALGAITASPKEADLVLLVNNAAGETAEASTQTGKELPALRHFALARQVETAAGTPLALADVAFANGADDALMRLLARRRLLPRLAAYAGWNTAGNSTGFALAHGALYASRRQKGNFDQDTHARLLLLRLTEDWGFQARLRPRLLGRFALPHGGAPVPPGLLPSLLASLNEELGRFYGQYLQSSFGEAEITAGLPWNRLFEVSLKIN